MSTRAIVVHKKKTKKSFALKSTEQRLSLHRVNKQTVKMRKVQALPGSVNRTKCKRTISVDSKQKKLYFSLIFWVKLCYEIYF